MKEYFVLLPLTLIACSAAPSSPELVPPQDSGGTSDSGAEPDAGTESLDSSVQKDASSMKDSGAAPTDSGADVANSCAVTQDKMLYPTVTAYGDIVDDQSAWGTFSCPDSNEPSYRIPRDPDKGRCTNTEIDNFYEAYMGPNANYPARQSFESGSLACKSCLVTEYLAPGRSGPVLHTPEDHYIANVAGCVYSLDPIHASCAKILYNYNMCKEQVCGCSKSQGTNQNTYSQCFSRVDGIPFSNKTGDCHYAHQGDAYARYTVGANQPGAACVTGTEKNRYTVTAKIQCGQ